jgi:hypothetical protein
LSLILKFFFPFLSLLLVEAGHVTGGHHVLVTGRVGAIARRKRVQLRVHIGELCGARVHVLQVTAVLFHTLPEVFRFGLGRAAATTISKPTQVALGGRACRGAGTSQVAIVNGAKLATGVTVVHDDSTVRVHLIGVAGFTSGQGVRVVSVFIEQDSIIEARRRHSLSRRRDHHHGGQEGDEDGDKNSHGWKASACCVVGWDWDTQKLTRQE